jgi:AraC-like DNA-binding protein
MREEELLPWDLHIVEHADEPDVTACPRGANGLHHRLLRADGLDDRVRAEPAGELLDPCRALLAALGHDLGRAELPGEPLAGLVPAHRDDPIGAELIGGEHCEQPHGAVADDCHRLAWTGLGHPAPREHKAVRAFEVSPLDAGLLDAVVRLVGLLDSPADVARFLRPLVTREIVFRLLKGEQGDRLRQIAVLGGHSHRIARALERLRKDFDRPLRIEDIARELGMSVSGFHHHFKAVTAMSPLQFQKRMRLQEARHLMLAEDLDAASAGYRVGYSDASHFNREYKTLFGAPPMRDVERLREGARESAACEPITVADRPARFATDASAPSLAEDPPQIRP